MRTLAQREREGADRHSGRWLLSRSAASWQQSGRLKWTVAKEAAVVAHCRRCAGGGGGGQGGQR